MRFIPAVLSAALTLTHCLWMLIVRQEQYHPLKRTLVVAFVIGSLINGKDVLLCKYYS